MTITRVGTNQKYADGWEAAFSRKKAGGSGGKSAQKKPSPSKKTAGKKAAKGGKR